MTNWRSLLAKFRASANRRGAEEDAAREIASHLALIEEEYERRGLTREQARLAARRTLGGAEQAHQLHRDARVFLWLEQTLQDLRHACRALLRSPGFTLVAIATLALGVGVNTTLFTAYNAVALKPLPVADAGRVVRLERLFESRSSGDFQYAFSYPEYENLRDHESNFASTVATSWPIRLLVSPDGQRSSAPISAQGQLVSGNYFGGLGIGAAIGRVFGPDEDRAPGANPVAVLSHAFWQRQFHADPQAIGRILEINGFAFTIIGVTPASFTGTSLNPQVPDLWAPIAMQQQFVPGQYWLRTPTDFAFQVLARLQPGVAMRQAEAETDTLVRQFATSYTTRDRTLAVKLQATSFLGNTEDINFRAGMAGMMAVFFLVLLVACANVTNMLLARGAARQREISVRMALGASRMRVIRHLLTESVLLSLAGGAAGLGLAVAAGKLLWIAMNEILIRQQGADFVFSLNFSPDWRVLVYVFVLCLATGIIFGLSPALQITRRDLSSSLKDDTTSFGHGVSRSRLRSLLIGGQVAVSMLLLTSAGLLVRGLARSQHADPGFATRSVYLMRADFGDDPARASVSFHRMLDWLGRQPEVRDVGYGTAPMLGTWTPRIVIRHSGSVAGEVEGRTLASFASDHYLDSLGIPLLRGRNFTPQESAAGTPVAIISAATARQFWPGEDPIGKRFRLDLKFDGKLTEYSVIGIARDVRFANLTRIDPAHVYFPPDPAVDHPVLISLRGDPQSSLRTLWSGLRDYDPAVLPSIRLWNMETMVVSMQRTLSRSLAALAGILALLSLTLAGIGIYGVMAYVVSQRTREIGLRIALGATPARVVRSVAVEGLRPVLAGMAIGLAGGAAASLLLHSTLALPGSLDFLYGVRFYDPITFLAITSFLVLISIVASLVPSVRAVRVDPVQALRYE
ncbi:MAG TPA: ABC transporter permease [Terracidiphilus sp.]|nr:ABC transporter permease [Terracidiphilus sp.]